MTARVPTNPETPPALTGALTKEEWAERCDGEPNTAGITEDGRMMLCAPDGTQWFVGGHKRHVHAALALHGQPFGFSRADVRLLRELSRDYIGEAEVSEHTQGTFRPAQSADDGEYHRMWGKNAAACRERSAQCASLASRIEALLPPEDSR